MQSFLRKTQFSPCLVLVKLVKPRFSLAGWAKLILPRLKSNPAFLRHVLFPFDIARYCYAIIFAWLIASTWWLWCMHLCVSALEDCAQLGIYLDHIPWSTYLSKPQAFKDNSVSAFCLFNILHDDIFIKYFTFQNFMVWALITITTC